MRYYLSIFILPLLLLKSPLLFASHQTPCFSHGEPDTIIDKTYHYLNDSFCQPALWFDDFFVDERVNGDVYGGTMVRWYNDFSLNDDIDFNYKTKLRVRLHLPKVTHRLKLVFEPDEEDSIVYLFPNETTEPESSLGLQYDWVTKERQSFNVKLTIRPSIEARYRYIYPLYESMLARFTQKIYQRKKTTGSNSLIDLDFSINKNILLRWSNFVKVETDNLIELGSGLTLYQFISETQALSYKASLTAQEKPQNYISNYHLSVAYRHNILRKWFYYEVIPEFNRNKELDSGTITEAKITLRLEVIFDSI